MITIQALTPDSFPLCAEWLSQPETNRWLTAEWRDRAVEPKTLAIFLRNKKNRVWLSMYKRVPCGIVAIADLDLVDFTGMAWYFLGEKSLSGKGITSDALKQMTAKAFTELGLKSLYAWTMEDNLPSRRVLEKAGFQYSGKLRQAAFSAGSQVNRIYFDITINEFH